MANNFNPLTPEWWDDKIQEDLIANTVALPLVNKDVFPAGSKKKGDVIHRPIRGADPDVVDYTPVTDIATQDITYTEDTILLNQKKTTKITQIDPFEQVQVLFDLATETQMQHARALSQYMDKDMFNQMQLDAATTIDNSLFGGVAGAPISAANITADNMLTLVNNFRSIMRQKKVRSGKGLFLVLPSTMIEAIDEKIIKDGFTWADETLEGGMRVLNANQDGSGSNGYQGRFRGVNIFFSNNLANNLPGATFPNGGGNDRLFAVGGVLGALDLAIQHKVTTFSRENPKNAAMNYWTMVLYGRSTPTNYKQELVKILVHKDA